MLEVGTVAPEFSLPDDTGRAVSLRELRTREGVRGVVVMFYPSDGTPLCTKEACVVRDRFDALDAGGIVVVGVSSQGTESKAGFRASHGLKHVLLADVDGKVAGLYQARGMFGLPVPFGTRRMTYVVGPDGRIVDRVHSEFSIGAHERVLMRALGGKDERGGRSGA